MDEPEKVETPETPKRPRVSIDKEAWKRIDAILVDMPYRHVAAIARLIEQTGVEDV